MVAKVVFKTQKRLTFFLKQISHLQFKRLGHRTVMFDWDERAVHKAEVYFNASVTTEFDD